MGGAGQKVAAGRAVSGTGWSLKCDGTGQEVGKAGSGSGKGRKWQDKVGVSRHGECPNSGSVSFKEHDLKGPLKDPISKDAHTSALSVTTVLLT